MSGLGRLPWKQCIYQQEERHRLGSQKGLGSQKDSVSSVLVHSTNHYYDLIRLLVCKWLICSLQCIFFLVDYGVYLYSTQPPHVNFDIVAGIAYSSPIDLFTMN